MDILKCPAYYSSSEYHLIVDSVGVKRKSESTRLIVLIALKLENRGDFYGKG